MYLEADGWTHLDSWLLFMLDCNTPTKRVHPPLYQCTVWIMHAVLTRLNPLCCATTASFLNPCVLCSVQTSLMLDPLEVLPGGRGEGGGA